MRTICKPYIAKIGHSKAVGYRNSTFSASSDLEALVDAYGIEAILNAAKEIANEIREYGDAIDNARRNVVLNSLPLPNYRKQNKPKAKKSKK